FFTTSCRPYGCASGRVGAGVTKFRRTAPSRPYDGLAEFSEEHKPRVAQLLVTAATLERGYQAFRESGNLQVFQPHDNELGSLHRQWLSDLDSLKTFYARRALTPKHWSM
ncbi:hypothetical protein, partial [Xanthomonas citri]